SSVAAGCGVGASSIGVTVGLAGADGGGATGCCGAACWAGAGGVVGVGVWSLEPDSANFQITNMIARPPPNASMIAIQGVRRSGCIGTTRPLSIAARSADDTVRPAAA